MDCRSNTSRNGPGSEGERRAVFRCDLTRAGVQKGRWLVWRRGHNGKFSHTFRGQAWEDCSWPMARLAALRIEQGYQIRGGARLGRPHKVKYLTHIKGPWPSPQHWHEKLKYSVSQDLIGRKRGRYHFQWGRNRWITASGGNGCKGARA